MLLAVRLWIGQKVFGTVGDSDAPVGVRVSTRRMIKWRCQEPELEGHLYAAAHTSIPVPKLYKVHRYRGRLALEMEYFRGCDTLQRRWHSFSTQQKRAAVDQVSGYIQQLRALAPPDPRRISSAHDGACCDVRVASAKRFGPFVDSHAFHQCLRAGTSDEAGRAMFGDEVLRIHARTYQACFTHGDLGAQNILVRDGRVAAIVDWECAGWYPEYWEYTKAHYNHVFLPEFYEMLRRVVKRYDEELEVERRLWRTLDQPLDEFTERMAAEARTKGTMASHQGITRVLSSRRFAHKRDEGRGIIISFVAIAASLGKIPINKATSSLVVQSANWPSRGHTDQRDPAVVWTSLNARASPTRRVLPVLTFFSQRPSNFHLLPVHTDALTGLLFPIPPPSTRPGTVQHTRYIVTVLYSRSDLPRSTPITNRSHESRGTTTQIRSGHANHRPTWERWLGRLGHPSFSSSSLVRPPRSRSPYPQALCA
nr:hypothetical protein CFP56_62716 [Quercus suber]